MKKKIKVTAAIALLSLAMGVVSLPSMAYNKILEKTTGETAYADGMTHENLKIYTDEGWINMNILRIDLEKNVDMTVVTDTYFSSRDTLTNLVKKNNDDKTIVAAINSDFFDTSNNTTMGTLVRDGEILSTSIGYPDFASFNISGTGIPYVAYINTPKNIVSNSTYSKTLSYINKPYLAYNRTIMFDSTFAAKSYGKTLGADILEILVQDGVIKEIRRSGEPFAIPTNGFVLASVGTDIAEMSSKFKVGDAITVKYDVNFRYLDLSVGGGTQLVKDGKVLDPFTQNITGVHPRTGLGITKDRKHIILVTVDGRTSSYRGVTQTELAKLLIQLGAYEAINLDGGGSTQMVTTSPFTGTIGTVNYPSDQVERKMYTGLAIRKILVDNPVLRQIQIGLKSSAMLLNEKMAISLLASDSNYNPMTVDTDKIKWSVTGVTGTFEKGFFTPTALGKGTIVASYGDQIAEYPIEVKKNAVKLIISSSVIKPEAGQEKQLYFSVITDEGQQITISSKSIKATLDASVGSFSSDTGIFKAPQTVKEGYITFEYDGLKAFVAVGAGVEKLLYADFESATGTFSGYPLTVTGIYQETSANSKFGKSGLLTYDFTKSTDTRAAYLILNKPIAFAKDAQGFGLWVLGDEANSHWLRAKVVDANGVSSNLTLASKVDWKGWKYISIAFPKELVGPITLERLYLVETDATKQDAGYIQFDNIEAYQSKALSVSVPADVTRVKVASDYKLTSGATSITQFLVKAKGSKTVDALIKNSGNSFVSPSNSFGIKDMNGFTLVTMVNNNNSIRKSDYTQWSKLSTFVNGSVKKPVVILMNDVYSFTDSLEQDLFFEQVKALTGRGIDVAVLFTTSNATYNFTRVSGATVIKIPSSDTSLTYLKIGVSAGKLSFETK